MNTTPTPAQPEDPMAEFETLKRTYDRSLRKWTSAPAELAEKAWNEHIDAEMKMRAYVAGLVRDKQRVDWLQNCEVDISTADDGTHILGHNSHLNEGAKLRDAIDTAIRAERGTQP